MAWNAEFSEVMTIEINGIQNFSAGTFDLRRSSAQVALRVDTFDGRKSFLRCGEDVGWPLESIRDPTSGWVAIAGTVKVSVDKRRRRAKIRVDDLVVQSLQSGAHVGSKHRITPPAQFFWPAG